MSDLQISRKPASGAVGQAQDERPLTPRERLRAHRQQLLKDSTRLFVLPGYDAGNSVLGGQLVARYRRLGFEELNEAFRHAGADVDVVAMNAQFLVDSCVEILIREPDGTFTPLVDGHKTTYTVDLETGESLGTIMALEHLPSIRDQMVAEFGENEVALNEHSGEVHRWMVAANDADAETALGEASAR